MLAATSVASAQEPFFKCKTLRIVVPFAPGGAYDI
jgi:tripartite-type tricarboxylate transporter receptor subunit TctC